MLLKFFMVRLIDKKLYYDLLQNCLFHQSSHTTPAKELADYYECVARVRNQYSFDHLLVLEDDVGMFRVVKHKSFVEKSPFFLLDPQLQIRILYLKSFSS